MKPWVTHCQSHLKRCLTCNITSSQRPWKLPSVLHLSSSLGPNSGLLTLISVRVLVFYIFNTPLLTLCILAFLYSFSSFFFIFHFTGCLGWGLSNLTLRPKKPQLQKLPASDKEKEQKFLKQCIWKAATQEMCIWEEENSARVLSSPTQLPIEWAYISYYPPRDTFEKEKKKRNKSTN